MRGHVRERKPGRWELRAYAGRDPLTRRERYRTRTVNASGRRQAETLLASFVAEVATGPPSSSTNTFGELVERWMDVSSPGWSPKNRLETPRMVELYLGPLLDVRLDRLTTADLASFYAALRDRGGLGGRPLKGSSVRRIHAIVHRCLEQGVIWGVIARNPADRISPSVDDTEVRPPTAEQVLALFDEAERDNPDFAVFLMMAVVTGARRGALCALRWSDFGVRGVTLARVISDGPDGPVEVPRRGRVKGRAQTIAVASETMAALAAHRQRMAERAQACGVELAGDAYVFSEDPAGRRFLHPDTASHRFKRLCTRLGLDDVRLHDLRHFVATTLLSEGVDLATVAGRLGHARGGQTTLGVYAHFLPAPDQAAAELLAHVLQRPRDSSSTDEAGVR